MANPESRSTAASPLRLLLVLAGVFVLAACGGETPGKGAGSGDPKGHDDHTGHDHK